MTARDRLPLYTAGILAGLLILNLGLFWAPAEGLLTALQLDLDHLGARPWGLLTGNLVHYSPSHLLFDLGGLAILGLCFCERDLGWRWPVFLLLCSLVVGASVALFPGEIRVYRGFSGVDHGALMLALFGWRRDRRVWLVGGAFFALVAYQTLLGGPPLWTHDAEAWGMPVPLAHLSGMLFGCLAAVWLRRSTLTSSSAAPTPPS